MSNLNILERQINRCCPAQALWEEADSFGGWIVTVVTHHVRPTVVHHVANDSHQVGRAQGYPGAMTHRNILLVSGTFYVDVFFIS